MDTDPHITGGEIAGMNIEDCKIEGCSLKRCQLDGCETVYQDTEATVAKLVDRDETIAAQTRDLAGQRKEIAELEKQQAEDADCLAKEITELKASLGSQATDNHKLLDRIQELSAFQNDYTRMTKQRIEVNKTLEADVAELRRQSKVDCVLADALRTRITEQDAMLTNRNAHIKRLIETSDDLERDNGVLKQDAEMWKETAKLDAGLLADERKESDRDCSRRIDEYHTTARILRCQRDKFQARVDELEDRFSEELECKHCVKGQAHCPRCHGTGVIAFTPTSKGDER